MRKLILIRHSNAESGSFNIPDFERDLTNKGIKRAKHQANEINARDIEPTLIITSSAIRALETTNIFNTVLNCDCTIQNEHFLYEDFTTTTFFKLLNSIDNRHSTVIIVGHNPTISTMAYRICSDISVSFRPCEIAVFNIKDTWNNLEIEGGNLFENIAP